MKLNLGCGETKKEGFVGVDKYPPADVVFDLDKVYDKNGNFNWWPWDNNSADEVMMHHSLEHMGETTEGFFHVMKELYRVCKNGAKIDIVVPHPRHDDFINDPTHVRIITPDILNLFSKKECDYFKKVGAPNTQLAYHLNVDFEAVQCIACYDEAYKAAPEEDIRKMGRIANNVFKQFQIELKVIK